MRYILKRQWKKKSKVFLLVSVGLLSVGFLTACSSSSKMSGKTYNYVYGGDPATLDYLAANKKNMTTAVSNGVDGLFENDQYGNLKPSVAERLVCLSRWSNLYLQDS